MGISKASRPQKNLMEAVTDILKT